MTWVVPPSGRGDARDDDLPAEDVEAALTGLTGCEDVAYESLRTTAAEALAKLDPQEHTHG